MGIVGMSPAVVHPDTTRRVVDGEISPDELHERIMGAYAELYSIITEDVSKITADDTEKLGLIRSLAETYLDFDLLDGLF